MNLKAIRLLFVAMICVNSVGCERSSDFVPAPDVLVLEGTTLIDGSGSPPVSESLVLISEGRILRVGRVGDLSYPDTSVVIDLRGKWLVPGFVEMHAHLPTDESSRADALDEHLKHGVTTIVDPAGSNVGLSQKVATRILSSPRVFAAGPALNTASFLDGQPQWTTVALTRNSTSWSRIDSHPDKPETIKAIAC